MGLDFISLMRTKYGLQIITPQIKNEFHLRLSPHIYNTLEDIDFAVEGLPATSHYRALSQVDGVVSLPADLVRWEDADDVLRAQISEGGILVYERA